MKTCTLCKTPKSLEDFNKKKSSKDGLQDVCRGCSRERSRAYYAANPDKHRLAVKVVKAEHIKRNRAFLVEALSGGCVDCGLTDIRVLEFDHIDGEKLDGVARMVRSGSSLKRLAEEIAKCEVRCKNHHAIKTFERIGKTWHDEYMPS